MDSQCCCSKASYKVTKIAMGYHWYVAAVRHGLMLTIAFKPMNLKGNVYMTPTKQRTITPCAYLKDKPNIHASRLWWGEINKCPDSKVHGDYMGPTWVLSSLGGPHVGPMNLAIWVAIHYGVQHDTMSGVRVAHSILFIWLDVYKLRIMVVKLYPRRMARNAPTNPELDYVKWYGMFDRQWLHG